MLGDLFKRTVACSGERPALIGGGRRVSWRALDARVDQAVEVMRDAGVMDGDLVALALPGDERFVAAHLATLACGAASLLLDPSPGSGPPPSSHWLLAPDREDRAGVGISEAVEPIEGVSLVRRDGSRPRFAPAPAIVQRTSGTTGAAREIARSHAACIAEVRRFLSVTALGPSDVIGALAPFHHSHGLFHGLWAALASGAALAMPEASGPVALTRDAQLRLLQAEGCTVAAVTPYHLEAMLAGDQRADLSRLRWCLSAGAPAAPDLAARFERRFGARVRQLYGCTELGAIAVDADPAAADDPRVVGRPLPGIRIELRGEDGATVSDGEVGEIFVDAPASDAPDDAPGDVSARWVGTGDLGRLDAAGRLIVAGRAADLIVIAGRKIFPEEVEHALEQHDAVVEAAVVPRTHPRLGQVPVAHVVLRPGETGEDLRAHCLARLASWKTPQAFVFHPALPRGPSGKLLRRALSDRPA